MFSLIVLSTIFTLTSALPTDPSLEARKSVTFGPGDEHVFNKTGNLHIHVGDNRVNWGTFYPSFATGIMHNGEICPVPGQCYPSGFTRPSTFVDTGSKQGSVTIKPFSSQIDTAKDLDMLLDALGKAMQIATGEPKMKWASNCVMPYGTCDPYVKQWHTAKQFQVATFDPRSGVEGISLGFTASFDRGDPGFCEEVLSLFSAAAGVFGPGGALASAGLSIGSLFCDGTIG